MFTSSHLVQDLHVEGTNLSFLPTAWNVGTDCFNLPPLLHDEGTDGEVLQEP